MSSRWPRPTVRLIGLGRALALLLACYGLTACVAQPYSAGYGRPAGGLATQSGLTPPTGRRVALLLPLSGANAQLGQSMLLAAKLAYLSGPDNAFDTQDTRSTPDGAAAATRAAAAAGAGIIVGPLTATETSAVTPLARAGNIPVLAFTSDSSKAQPGVWPLGLTPAQQVRTLVRAAAASSTRRIGAILPSDPFGNSLAASLAPAAIEAGLPPPTILRYDARSGLDGAIARLGNSGGAPGAPPAIDALLLGTTAEATLRAMPTLIAAGLGPDRVRLLGTALWGRDPSKLASLAGAWFAGPPATTLKVFGDNYIAHYGTPPRDIASIAFDATAASRAASTPAGVDLNLLLNPSGFSGANGEFRLLADGTVRRTLTLFEIGPEGVHARDMPPEGAMLPAM